MKVLVIGSGGREHALCRSFQDGGTVAEIFCAPGNAGISSIAECVPIAPEDIDSLAAFAKSKGIDLAFVGGESSLAMGIVDRFRAEGLRIVGPTRDAARLESSKAFAKEFMERNSIPTARSATASSTEEALAILGSGFFGDRSAGTVVKADGLAAGKGVIVAADRGEAESAVRSLAQVAGAEASSRIVLEELLFGNEISLLAFCDGESYKLMPPVRDHKRIGDGDSGPNTGGMGTIADPDLISPKALEYVEREVVSRTLAGCKTEGFPFTGILFVGLMMTADGPKVLEFNTRFGDPETQVILPLLHTDLFAICSAINDGTLEGLNVQWSEDRAACVVLAAHGYPGSPQKGDIIYGLDLAEAHSQIRVYHAGTAKDAGGHFITNGGRVLGVSATGVSLAEALDRAYLAVNDISWNGMQFRHDIGR